MMVSVVLLAVCACDPSCDEEWTIENRSGHNVTITRYVAYGADEHPRLNAGESLLAYNYGGLGSATWEDVTGNVRNQYWSDSVRFTFDDSTARTFYAVQDSASGPYNFMSSDYAYEEKVKERGTFKGLSYWARLTYTLTPEFYELCKEGN